MSATGFQSSAAEFVVKGVDSEGVVYGWGIVSTIKGEPYFDLQDDHIPDEVMRKATTNFMLVERTSKDMHSGDRAGIVVHSFPLTKELATLFGVQTEKTGWLVGVKFFDEALTQKFRTGERTGFSIGGFLTESEAA